MTMSAITQVGGSLLSSLFSKNKKPTQPPMKSDPSFGVEANDGNLGELASRMRFGRVDGQLAYNQTPWAKSNPSPSYGVMANNVNPLPAYQNKVQAPAYQAPQPQGNGLPGGYNSYGGGNGFNSQGTIMSNLQPPQTGAMNNLPSLTPGSNASMNVNGNNPDSNMSVTEDNSLKTSIPALVGSGASVLYDIFNQKKPEQERVVDPYTKQMVSQSANTASMTNANANNIAGSVMAGASGAADKATTASLGNSMATGGGVDNMALGASKSAIESNQMNTAYSGGMAQGGSIASQAGMNHAQTLGRASDQTMYRESVPKDSAGMMALQGLSALPKVMADGETFKNQQDWRRGYSHTAKSGDSLYQTGQAQSKKKNGVYNPLDMNNIFSTIFGGSK